MNIATELFAPVLLLDRKEKIKMMSRDSHARRVFPNKDELNILRSGYINAALLQNSVGHVRKLVMNTNLVPQWVNDYEFWYRHQGRSGDQFQLVDVKSATKRAAFDHHALASALSELTDRPINPDNLPITRVDISLTKHQIKFSAFHKNWAFSTADKKLDCLSDISSMPVEWLLAPDHRKAAFVRDYNLWIKDLTTGEEFALTNDGEKYNAYASPSLAWGDCYDFYGLQARWSPDSARLFTVQVDNRQVKSTPIVRHIPSDGSLRPTLKESRISLSGDEHIEQNRLLVINYETRGICFADYETVPSTRCAHGLFNDGLAWWARDSRHAYFIDIKRGDNIACLVELDTHSGTTRTLFEEISDTPVRLSLNKMDDATILPLPGTNELIWFSERSGWSHLYLYDLTSGQLKHPITRGDWMVRQLLHFDTTRRELWLQTAGRIPSCDPYYLDICRVNIDTGELVTIASGNWEYTVFSTSSMEYLSYKRAHLDLIETHSGVSPGGDYVVTTRSRVDQLPMSLVFNREGRLIMELDVAEITGLVDSWHWPEPVRLTAADGLTDIYGVIFRPSSFSSDRLYPVIDCSISIVELATVPKGSFDNAQAGGCWYLQAAALAEVGFIVVMIDGRGTPYREKSFSDASYGWRPAINFSEDRIAGIKQLASRYPYMDVSNVGIMGFNANLGAVYGLLEHPNFYKVGVSHGINHPKLGSALNTDHFEGVSPSTQFKDMEQLAGNLRGRLLLMHGMNNTMAPPAGTFRLVEALKNANKDFDMLILPNEGINAEGGGHITSLYAFRRTWDYFVRHLKNTEPPNDLDLGEEE